MNNLSIVINCKDRQEDIDRLFRSLEIHHFCDSEIILLDDGSATPLRAPSYAKIFRNEKSAGVGAGRNFLVSKATREYVLVCDDDVEITRSDLLDRPLHFCRKYDNKVLIASSQSDAQGAVGSFQPSAVTQPSFVHRFIAHCFLVPRKQWAEAGGLCEPLVYQFEDTEFSWRWFDAGFRIIHDPGFLVIHHVRAGTPNQMRSKHRQILRNMLISTVLRMPALTVPPSLLQSILTYRRIAREFGWKATSEISAASGQFFRMLPVIVPARKPLKYKTLKYYLALKKHPIPA